MTTGGGGAAVGSEVPELVTDVLVIGGGMAGLSAGASAAMGGADVILLEAADEPGGAAGLSDGYVWTVPTIEDMRSRNPLGDPALAAVVVEGFDDAVRWISSLGFDIGPVLSIYFGRGHQIDIHGYLARCVSTIEARGYVLRAATVQSLIVEDGVVVGADLIHGGEPGRIRARHTILATGGFAANAEWRAAHINPNARDMLVRTSPFMRGDGIRLALAVGASLTDLMHGFYGHLVASPQTDWSEKQFGPMSQYLSSACVLVNVAGDRFADESAYDAMNTQAVLRQPGGRAWMVADERIHRDVLSKPHRPGLAWFDRFAYASAAGAHFAMADTLEGLADELAAWGVDRDSFLRTMAGYNSGSILPDEPPRSASYGPLREAPFYALEVQPAITFTHGGLRVDAQARALDEVGEPIRGLLVAGADAGGVYHKAYAGGLAAAITLGRRAARTATELAAPSISGTPAPR